MATSGPYLTGMVQLSASTVLLNFQAGYLVVTFSRNILGGQRSIWQAE